MSWLFMNVLREEDLGRNFDKIAWSFVPSLMTDAFSPSSPIGSKL